MGNNEETCKGLTGRNDIPDRSGVCMDLCSALGLAIMNTMLIHKGIPVHIRPKINNWSYHHTLVVSWIRLQGRLLREPKHVLKVNWECLTKD